MSRPACSVVIVTMHDTEATKRRTAGDLPRRGLGPAQGEQREPGGLRPRDERSGAEDARRRLARRSLGEGGRQRASRGAARQRGGNRGADTAERRRQPGRSATGRSAAGRAERRADGVRAGGRPAQQVPDHARRPGLLGASERAPREPGHTDPAAVSTAEATRTQPRADEPREERARRPAAASASASAPGTAKVEARAAAQWAQRGPRRTGSAVADSEARSNAQRGRDGDGAGSTERRVSPELPRGLAAAGGDGRYRTGATPARAEGGSRRRERRPQQRKDDGRAVCRSAPHRVVSTGLYVPHSIRLPERCDDSR